MRERSTWDLTEIRKRANGEKLIRAELALAAAQRMLPDADESVIEDQAVALCYLPDDELIDTATRLKAADESREPKTAVDRYFDEQMSDPEFAGYYKERAAIDQVDARVNESLGNLWRYCNDLQFRIRELEDRLP